MTVAAVTAAARPGTRERAVTRVLVVDEDPAFRTLLLALLGADAGAFEPLAAASGEEALQILLSGVKVDWLLIDVALPGIDGLQVLMSARQLLPDLKIMVLTAAPNGELHQAALESGADRLLAKPLDYDDLLATLAGSRPGRLSYLQGDLDLPDLCHLSAACHPRGGVRVRCTGGEGLLVPQGDGSVRAGTDGLTGAAAWETLRAAGPWYFQSLTASEAAGLDLGRAVPLQADPRYENGKAGGCLRGLTLRHLIQWIARFGLSCTATVTAGRNVGALAFEAGRIRRAETADLEGGQAAGEILSWESLRVELIRSPTSGNDRTVQEDLQVLLTRFSRDVEGFLATCVVRRTDARAIGSFASEPRIDAAKAAELYAGVVESHLEAVERLGLGSAWGETEDVLITLAGAYVLVRLLGADHYHWLAVSGQANLALSRHMMRNHEAFLLGALAGG